MRFKDIAPVVDFCNWNLGFGIWNMGFLISFY